MNILALALAYLLGSIPFGYLIVKLTSGSDIRKAGSGGTGATNVTRNIGRGGGIATLALDLLKGSAAVLLARWLTGTGGTSWTVAASAVLAVAGHCFPIWLGFRAGKGVATGLGVFLVVAPWPVLAAAVIFVLIVWRTHYVSLGSITAAIFVPLWVVVEQIMVRPVPDFPQLLTALCASSALIIAKHSANIKRLMAGTENRFEI